MGIRETLNEKPAVTTAVTAGIVLLALLYILYSVWPRTPEVGVEGGREFYTRDLGETLEPLPAGAIFRLDDAGQAPNVRAWVFRYPGEEQFVAYLEKVTPERAERRETVDQDNADGGKERRAMGVLLDRQDKTGHLVAQPGGEEWVAMDSPQGREISRFPSRDGRYAAQVLPE